MKMETINDKEMGRFWFHKSLIFHNLMAQDSKNITTEWAYWNDVEK